MRANYGASPLLPKRRDETLALVRSPLHDREHESRSGNGEERGHSPASDRFDSEVPLGANPSADAVVCQAATAHEETIASSNDHRCTRTASQASRLSVSKIDAKWTSPP